MSSQLIGRDREIGRLFEWLDEVLGGCARLVMCVGEPGIGKTRLADEFSRAARARGVATAWGRPADSTGAPPYWPWREVLRSLDDDPSVLYAIAHVAPGQEPSWDERIRWFDAVSAYVQLAARSRPLLLVLDDLHAADEPSQLLTRHVARTARDAPLLLLATCRDTIGPLAGLAREPNATTVSLRGLARSDVRGQIADIVGREPTEAELGAVFDATSGNPYFVTELARQLADGGGFPNAVPAGVMEAIGQRLAQLSHACVATLGTAAVLGTEFDVGVLATMTDHSEPECTAVLGEAARAALVVAGSSRGDWRFAHDLIRDAIVAGIDADKQRGLHRRAAEVIEKRHASWLEPVLFDLAEHWARAAVGGDEARALHWLERAGDEAMRLHAYEDGRRWYARALDLNAPTVDEPATARLLLALGAAQSLSADFRGALKSCQQAMDIAVRLGLSEIAGQAALVPEPTFEQDLDQVIRGLCERALAGLGPAPAALRARVLAQYAVVCDHLSDLDAAHPAVDEALQLAERSGDEAAIESALTARQMVRSGPDGLAEREVNADRMWALGARTGNPAAFLAASEWRFDAASEHGDLVRAAREVEEIARWANQIGGPIARWRLLRCRAMLAQACGRFADAYRYGSDALATMAPTGFPAAYLLWSGFISIMSHQTGQTPESLGASGITDADAADQDWPLQGVIQTLAPAAVLVDVGRLREAALIYRRLGAAAEWRESPHAALFTWVHGIAVAIATGADDDVAVLRGKLSGYRGHHVVNGRYAMAYGGPVEYWLGIAAAYLGLFGDAVADLEQAVKVCTVNGAAGFRAEAEYELAAALLRRAAPGDLLRARGLAIEAGRAMDALGMPPIRAKVTALLERIDADPSVALTRREREVAELVAQGMTNREIAARLYLSERTAQNHVQHILDKLNLPNRSRIAVWVQGAKNE